MLSFAAETTKDITSIREVVTAAFGQTSEAELIEVIRHSPNFIPELSIVALENGDVLGHILFSAIAIQTEQEAIPALALAPLAVTPMRQQQGIGSQLVDMGLSKCRELGHSIVVIVGNPLYYERFGFQKASQFGLHSSLPFPDEIFMVLELKPGVLSNIRGSVQYPAYFEGV
jgi:putative acetyltransferase